MALYKYVGCDTWGNYVAGIVEASNLNEAANILENAYRDYRFWEDTKLEKVAFNNGVCEVYYG